MHLKSITPLWLAALFGASIGTAMAQDNNDPRDIYGVYLSERAETPCGRATALSTNDKCPIKQMAVDLKFAADEDPLLDPGLQCEPARLVRLFTWFPRPMEIIKGDNEIIFRYENMGVVRTIHMDGMPRPPEDWKSIHGFSIGEWQGNTLVIETTNLMDNYWVIPTSDETRTIERYRWNDDRSRLLLDVEVFDPVFYNDSFNLQPAAFEPQPDGYIGSYECSVQTESLFYGDDLDAFFGD